MEKLLTAWITNPFLMLLRQYSDAFSSEVKTLLFMVDLI